MSLRDLPLYEKFDALKALMEIVESPKSDGVEFNKMIQTGDLGFNDYGVGFLNFHIYSGKFGNIDKNSTDTHQVRMSINTIDDGDMGGWSKFMTKEKADALVRKVVEEVVSTLLKFPTLEKLNEQLVPHGLYMMYE